MPKKQEETPEFIPPVRGYRWYHLTPEGLLVGGAGVEWPDRIQEATCWGDKKRFLKHIKEIPGSCHCGIYIAREPDYSHGMVRACCTGWGAVAVEEQGWHVEFCRIDKLQIQGARGFDADLVKKLEGRYGVPVERLG